MENLTVILSVLATVLGVFATWQGIIKNNKDSFNQAVLNAIRGSGELRSMIESVAKSTYSSEMSSLKQEMLVSTEKAQSSHLDNELKIRTIEMTLTNLSANTATRSEMAEIRADMKTLIARLDDLRELIKSKN